MPKPKRNTLKIFFASSGSLTLFRKEIDHIVQQIEKWHPGLAIEVVKWETDLESGSYDAENVQAEINPLLEDSDVVFVLIREKVGQFTLEEYRLARELEKKVFVFFLEPDKEPDDAVLDFRKQLEEENRSIERHIDDEIAEFRYWATIDLQNYLVREWEEGPASWF